MALATRCPHCQTIFRVANDQLKLHAGLVRCGSCQQTFNGVEHLVPPHELNKSHQSKPDVVSNITTAQALASPVARSALTPAETTEPEVAVQSAPLSETAPPAADQVAIVIDETATEKAIFPSAAKTEATPAAVIGDAEIREKTNDLPEDLEQVLAAKTKPEPEAPEVPATPVPESAASLDFFLGEEDPFAEISATPPETLLARVELETKAAMLEEPSIDWSVADNVNAEDDQRITASDDSEVLPATMTAIATDELQEPQEPYLPETMDAATLAQTGAALERLATETEDSVSNTGADEEEKPEFVLQAEKAEKRGRLYSILMILLSLILLPALIAQTGYIFRNQIAAAYPETRSGLEQVCRIIHCQISLPAQIDYITIESNELQALSPGKNTYSLVMQLQNRSNTVQSWPAVELVLNDAKDKPVLQKAFTPKNYLSEPADIAKGFAPGTEKNIKLYFDLPKLKASGYHVSVFYP